MRKTALLTGLIIAFVAMVKGQEPIRENPCVFVDDNGKIYVNKKLPVYLWISASPEDDAPVYRLTSDSSRRYTNPMYFDTEGINTVFSPRANDTMSGNPESKVLCDVYADSYPPVTHIRMSGKGLATHNGMNFYSGKVLITLTATDAVSGISSSYYSINGKSFETYAGPFTLEADGKYRLAWYSVDRVGNQEGLQERNFMLDNSAPVTTFSIEGLSDNKVTSRTSIVLKSTDELSGVRTIYYRINKGTEYVYTAPIPFKKLADGRNILTFYSVDNLLNREAAKTLPGDIPGIPVK
jgi:hypothetical protein